MEELQKQLSAELEREREVVKREGREGVESVRREARDEVERVRREVEEERAEEEWKLRDRKLRNMSELKKMVQHSQQCMCTPHHTLYMYIFSKKECM